MKGDGGGKQVMGHTGILMGMELGIRVIDAAVSVILARYLLPEGFGLLAFGISFGSLFSILPGAGMGSLMTRDVAKNPGLISRHLSNGMAAKFFLSLGTLALMGAVAAGSGFPAHKIQIVLIAGLLMIMETSLRFTVAVFQGLRRMWSVAVTNLSVRIGWLLFSLSVVMWKGDLFALLWVRVFVTALALAATLGVIHFRVQRIRWSFDPAASWRIVKSSFPFALFRIRGTVYTDLGTVLISVLAGDALTGWYAAAHKVLRVLTFIPASFSGALLPTLSKMVEERPKDAAWTLNRSCRYLLIISLPVSAGMSVLAPGFVSTLYGPGYEGAAEALRILIFMVPFSFQNGSLLAGVGAVNKERQAGWVLISGAGLLAAASLAVIPRFGHIGAAFAALSAEIFILVLQARLLKEVLPGFRIADVKPALWAAALAMAGCAWVLRGLPWGIALAVSFALYLALIMLWGIFTAKDRETLIGIFRRKQAGAPAAEMVSAAEEEA